jgi:hypothetical protein
LKWQSHTASQKCLVQPVTGLQFHRDGGLFTSSALDEIKVWNVEELISVFTFHASRDRVTIHVLHDALTGTGLAKTRTIRIADLREIRSKHTHSLVGVINLPYLLTLLN